MLREELSELLFNKIYKVEPYPNSVASVTKMINNTAFFPGGRGLWMENETVVFPSILVLGQDFSNEKEYLKMLSNNSNDLDGPTWRNLIKLFNQADINLCDCFFSNVFMGLRKTESMIGKFPGFNDKEFFQRNLEFLRYQIDVVKPKVIITLGIYVPIMLAKLSEIDLTSWKEAKTFKDTDLGVKFDVRFDNHQCTCVALIHPCMRNTNVKQRRYKNFMGNDAELNMLKDAFVD